MTGWTSRGARVAAGVTAAGFLLAGGVPALAAGSAPAALAARSAPAGGPPVAESFTILPTPAPGATKLIGDISLIVYPGHSYPESVSVINYARATTKFWLYPADAYTIRKGGGFAVEPMRARPRDVGSWVSRLPKVITVPGRKQLNIRFRIRVLAGDRDRGHQPAGHPGQRQAQGQALYAGLHPAIPDRGRPGHARLRDRRTGSDPPAAAVPAADSPRRSDLVLPVQHRQRDPRADGAREGDGPVRHDHEQVVSADQPDPAWRSRLVHGALARPARDRAGARLRDRHLDLRPVPQDGLQLYRGPDAVRRHGRGGRRAAPAGPGAGPAPAASPRGPRPSRRPRGAGPGIGLIGPGGKQQREGRAGRHRAPGQRNQLVRHRAGGDDRVAPRVGGDELGQQLNAQAMGLAGDRVHPQPRAALAHRPWLPGSVGMGSMGDALARAHGPPRAWARTSSPNTSSALAASTAAPSGRWQAPRPVMSQV